MSEETKETTEETTEEVVEEAVETVEETDYKDQYLRLMAELANFKKRTQKESLATYANAVCDTVEKLLPFIDSFDRAVSSIEEDNSPLAQGLLMIYKQLEDVLEKLEVKKIEALNCQFDPNFHNAVMHEDNDEVGENTIVEEFMAGYMYKDKVIRHSMVKVAN